MKLLQSASACVNTKFIYKNPALAGKIIISGEAGSGIFMADGTSVVDSDGNIDAPVTSTDLTLSGTLAVTGASTLTGAVGAAASITLGAGADLIGSATSDITINTNKFTVAGATGNTLVAGTFDSTGLATMAAAATVGTTLGVTGLSTLTGGATIGGALIQGGTGAITSTSGAGAVAVTGQIHEVTTTGTGDALTLADGTAGQRLSVIYVAEGAGGDTGVITPTTLAGGSTITLNALGDSADLVFSATGGWYVLGLGGTAAVA